MRKKPRILLLCRYGWLGASSRVRFRQYLPYLEERGFRFTIAPFFPDEYLVARYGGKTAWALILRSYLNRIGFLLRARRFDAVWLEGEALPWLPAGIEKMLLSARVPVIADYDDALFHRYDLHRAASVRGLLGRKIDRIIGLCVGMTTTSRP